MELAFHPIALELRFHAITFVLCVNALGDVANRCADEQALLGLDGRERNLGWDFRSVGSAPGKRDPRFHASCSWIAEPRVRIGRMDIARGSRNEQFDRPA